MVAPRISSALIDQSKAAAFGNIIQEIHAKQNVYAHSIDGDCIVIPLDFSNNQKAVTGSLCCLVPVRYQLA